MRYLVRVGENRYINLLNVTEIVTETAVPPGAVSIRYAGEASGNASHLHGEEADRFREFLTRMSVSVSTAINTGDSSGIVDLLRKSHQDP